jgi:hypothetical protein
VRHAAVDRLAVFLTRLAGVKRSGSGYLARCPAHDDHSPSLSIGVGKDGRILLHCWAGCGTKAILAALGMSWSDVFPTRSRGRR